MTEFVDLSTSPSTPMCLNRLNFDIRRWLSFMLDTLLPAPLEESRDLEIAIGRQIRNFRSAQELSVSGLAKAAGLAAGTISKLERGTISASLPTLNAVAEALNVPLSAFFVAVEKAKECFHIRNGQGTLIERRGTKAGHVYRLLGKSISEAMTVESYLIELGPAAERYTGFRHVGTELIMMLTGELVYQHAGREYNMAPGDALLFDAEALHGPSSIEKAPATFLSIIIYRNNTRSHRR